MPAHLQSKTNAPKPNKFKTNYARGMIAEYIAGAYLWCKGYRLLKHRFKTPVGEIDWIVQKDDTIIAVEVKLRKTLAGAQDSISAKSMARISKSLLWYVTQNPHFMNKTLRCDVIAMAKFSIQHLDNAWQETHTYKN